MAELITIARPYAEAAYQLARDSGQLKAWSAQLAQLAQVAANVEFAALLGNPNVAADQLEAVLVGALGKDALPEVARFVGVLLQNRRASLLPQIFTLFQTLKTAAEGVVDARIETAFALTDMQEADVVSGLEKRLGRMVKAEVVVDPALLGGVRIVVGDEVIDASVQGKLQAMAYRLKS